MSLRDDGTFQVQADLVLRPGMRHAELLAQPGEWEQWLFFDGAPVAWRRVFDADGGKKPEKTVLIVTFDGADGPMAKWQIAPWNLMDGAQSRPEGPHTKALREWFERRHGCALPLSRDWGHVDAAHDPHNQVTLVVCNLREGFASEREWQAYRNRNAR
ncbi:hypothetical protein DFR29_1086 [Tahibacter aquaticus]|uniref:Uncharacterized protein n=1 Tax=Tahibacter aquaticus TaxID=520092 RepID=A0A4R6YUT7_9GAMM|nr:hypothetical protein [Tahibacter aquaticus]TDR42423.1 hypothetical protein DFR29_1086 [Tahibacter aquaticus]